MKIKKLKHSQILHVRLTEPMKILELHYLKIKFLIK